MLSHGNLASNALTLREAWGFSAADVLLHMLPIYHAHGLFVAINTTLLAGARMIWLPRFEPGAVIAALPRASVLMGVPTHYVRLLGARRLHARGRGAACACSSPARRRCSRRPSTRFEARTGQRILERYGMTETGMNASNPLQRRAPRRHRRARRCRGSSCGSPTRTAGCCRRARPASSRCAGPTSSRATGGCRRRPARSSAPTASSSPATSRASTADGYVTIVGRAKDLIISGGLNVYPKEIESVIDALEGVAESRGDRRAAPGLRRGRAGGGQAPPGRAPRRRRGDHRRDPHASSPPSRCPKRVVFVDELPRNAMGKVQKNLLRDAYRDAFRAADA